MKRNPDMTIARGLAEKWPRRMNRTMARLYMCCSEHDFETKEPGAVALGYEHEGRMWWDKQDLDDYIENQKLSRREEALA